MVFSSTALKGVTALIAHNNTQELQVLEGFCDNQEGVISRAKILTCSDRASVNEIFKKVKVDIFFIGNLKEYDKLFILNEVAKYQPNSISYFIEDLPNLSEIKEAERIGTYVGTVGTDFLKDNKLIISHLIRAVRLKTEKIEKEVADFFKTASALVEVDEERKNKATNILCEILQDSDLSEIEKIEITGAQMLFSSGFSPDQVIKVFGHSEIAEHLKNCGSQEKETKPSSDKGFVLTLSDFLAKEVNEGLSSEDIITKVLERPTFLKHKAIRQFKGERLRRIISKVTHTRKVKHA